MADLFDVTFKPVDGSLSAEALLESARAYAGEYDPAKLSLIKEFGGSEVYARVTSVKCRGATALLRDIYTAQDRPWGFAPSPKPVVPDSVVKVIDQGADDSVNAASIRSFLSKVSGAAETWDTTKATILQSRHRIPEERLRADQVLVLQVPNPEPLRPVEPNMSVARQMHADADYGRLWLILYEQIVRSGRVMQGAAYPSLVNGRHVMTPSPIPRWDVPKLHMAQHLTFLSAGREKRLYAVPPFTKVEPLVFSDVPYQVENHATLTCHRSGVSGYFMNEIPQSDGSSQFELSDSHLGIKAIRRSEGAAVEIGPTWYEKGKMAQ